METAQLRARRGWRAGIARMAAAADRRGAALSLSRPPATGLLAAACRRWRRRSRGSSVRAPVHAALPDRGWFSSRSEEHTSELQSLMRISYAVFCLKKKKIHHLTLQPNIAQASIKC